MRVARIRAIGLIAVCTLAHGCALLAPVPDRSRFFTLPVPSEGAAQRSEVPQAGSDAAPGIVYGLGPITLPAYLDRREVATRVSPTELTYSKTDRWAEPLAANVASVLRQSLSEALGTKEVLLYPWVATVKVDYRIQIGVLRFERDTSGACNLTGRWSIADVRSGREVIARDATLTRPATPGDTAETAAALGGTLNDLSREIAAALRALPSQRPATTPAPRRK